MVCCKKGRAPHPRDGPWAWLVCFASTTINIILFGTLLSFGVFLPVLGDEFKASRGKTAWIGSLALGISFFCCPIAAKLIVHFGERRVGICSGVAGAFAMVGSSYVEDIMILYFSYGLLLGLCGSGLINGVLLIVSKCFKKRLALALGITASGSSLGTMIIGPMLQVLVDFIGWRGAFRVISGMMLLAGLMCLLFDTNIEKDVQINAAVDLGNKTSPRNPCARFLDCSMWKSPKYTVGTISIFLTLLGVYVPLIHLVKFAKDSNIPDSKSSLLFIYIGACSTLARVLIGKVLEKRWLTPLQSVQLSSFVIGTSIIVFTQVKTYTHFILISIFYGLGNGMFVSTQIVFFLTCFPDAKKCIMAFSMGLMVVSIAIFSGAPLAGFIADVFDSYIPAFYLFGGLVILSGTLPFCLLFIRQRSSHPEEVVETRLTLIGSRLANVETSLSTFNIIGPCV